MRDRFDTVLVVDCGGDTARKVIHAVRGQHVYSEVMTKKRFLEEKTFPETLKGVIIAGEAFDEKAEIPGGPEDAGVGGKTEKSSGRPEDAGICGKTEETPCGKSDEPIKAVVRGLSVPFTSVAPGDEKAFSGLGAFLKERCGCRGDWTVDAFIANAVEEIRAQAGGKKVICALSGGVDSSVSAMLVYKAIGDQLTCIFVDHGFMRKEEPAMIREVFAERFRVPLVSVDAESRYLQALDGVLDPERKRKIIGEMFIRIFEEEAKKSGGANFLVQGTIYPDVIESGDDAPVVKSHHNVGGLPEDIGFEGLIEPLRFLFKEEVRELGRVLGLPASLTERQPFPGPGLAIRCLGGLTKEKLDILRDADFIFREEVEKQGFRDRVSQYFAVMTGLHSVGVKDGERTYEYTIALRAVKTNDFMIAMPVEFPWPFLRHVTDRITNEVPRVNRVVYELTGKPPATIEWE